MDRHAGRGAATRTAASASGAEFDRLPARVGDPAAASVEETAVKQKMQSEAASALGQRRGGATVRERDSTKAQDAALDDERLRPEHRKQLEATADAMTAAPRNELSARTVTNVACGEQHTLCADSMGFCFSWGAAAKDSSAMVANQRTPVPVPPSCEPLSSKRVRRSQPVHQLDGDYCGLDVLLRAALP